jgi:RHS repeat-associated protein
VTWAALEGKTSVADCDAAASPLLDGTTYATITTFDAFRRPLTVTTPDGSITARTYGISGRVQQVTVDVHGVGAPNIIVLSVDYDTRGRRARLDLGDGISTMFTHDERTFRLKRLRTARASDGATLRDVHYGYDPVGNVMEIRDDATQLPVDATSSQYVYDALYRMTDAFGVEHPAFGAMPPADSAEGPLFGVPHPNDLQKLRDYHETYTYDVSGNLTFVDHTVLGAPSIAGWTRDLPPSTTSNRLQSTTVTGSVQKAFTYDDDGNILSLPNVGALSWDYANRLIRANLLGGGVAYYEYDSTGARTRKVVRRSDGFVEERVYLGSFEIFRRSVGGQLDLVRETLHASDEAARAALVETLTVSGGAATQQTTQRFQLGDHLDSSSIEVDESGTIISVEVYHPYGGTAFLGRAGVAEASAKRFRYVGKERDDESGLYYYGARYYSPWLSRWTSADPKGHVDGTNLFFAFGSNPLAFTDYGGSAIGPIGWVYRIVSYVQDVRVYYIGSAIGKLSNRLNPEHPYWAEMNDPRATVTAKEVRGQPKRAATARRTTLSAKSESVRSVEQTELDKVKQQVSAESAEEDVALLNKQNAASKFTPEELAERHSVEAAGRAKTLKLPGRPLRLSVSVVSIGLLAVQGFIAWRDEKIRSNYGTFVRYKQTDEIGDYNLEQKGTFFIDHYKVYRDEHGNALFAKQITSDERDRLIDEFESKYGYVNFWGNFVPGSLRKTLADPVPHFSNPNDG